MRWQRINSDRKSRLRSPVTNRDRALAGLLILFLALAGCASRKGGDGPPASTSNVPRGLPDDPIPRDEPRSRYGNGPNYEVFGIGYSVMPSNYGYQERGVASWYGKDFHGKPTSSMEPYDMHEMTAAHKTLPLPSFVKVRNLRNNKTIVVRVNDRGPFVDNRIIDLSYSAALKLDMIRDGTSLVEDTAISFDQPPQRRQAERSASKSTASVEPQKSSNKIYLQVGAFGDKSNAGRRLNLLREHGINKAFVHEESGRSPALYRVRIGPIAGVDQYDRVVAELERIGISESHLITE
jgi:rare lipoprotein A